MTVAQWIITSGGVVGALGVIFHTVIRPVLRWGKRIESAVSTVEQNMQNNGGSSLRDAIDRIEARLNQLEQIVAPSPVKPTVTRKKPTPKK
jgi:hypothetical protein